MKNTILNGGLTFQILQARVRALKVASLAVVAGILTLTGNTSAAPVATVITLNNGATDLTSAASYSIISNIPGAAVASVAPGMTPGTGTSILFYNNGLLPGGTTVDLYSIPNFSPTPFFPTVTPGPLTLTVNSNLTTASINDANAGLIAITNTSATADTLTIGGAGDNTNATPVATGTTPVGTGASQPADLIYVATGANLNIDPVEAAGTLTLLLPNGGNIDTNGTLTISDDIITNTITAQTLTFIGTGVTTVSGGISGLDAVEIDDGGGSVIFSGANTYTGDTLIIAGILKIQSDGALGTAAAFSSTPLITVSSGAALQIQGGITTLGTGTLTLNGSGVGGNGALENVSGNNTYTGLIFINSNTTIGSDSGTLTLSGGIDNGANTLTLTGAGDGVISGVLGNGAGGLTMIGTGTGTWDLTAANSYTGPTTVNAGTLQVGNGTTGSLNSATGLSMGGGTFELVGLTTGPSTQTVASLTTTAGPQSEITMIPAGTGTTTLLITSPTVTTGVGAALNFDVGGTAVGGSTTGTDVVKFGGGATAATAHGLINGSAAYTFTDSTGATYFATEISNTVVGLVDPGSAGLPRTGSSAVTNYFINSSYGTVSTTASGSLSLQLNGPTAIYSLTVNTTGVTTGANLDLNSRKLGITIASTTRGGGLLFTGPNSYLIQDTSGAQTGAIEGTNTAGPITINNYLTGAGTALTLAVPIANHLAVTTSVMYVGPGLTILTNSTTGAALISGANTSSYTGSTYFDGSAIQIGTGTVGGGTITPFSSGTVNVNGVTTLSTDGANTGGAYTVANAFVLNAPLTVNVPGVTALTLTGAISGAGTLVVNDGTTGTLTLTNGSNTYSGGTIVDGGTLTALNFPTPLGSTSGSITVNGSAGGTTLNLTTTGTTTLGSLSGTASNLDPATINTNTGSFFQVVQTTAGIYEGAIAGAGSLKVSGTAPLSLTGASTYSGGTTIDAGAVLAAGDAAALGSGAVTNNGTLETIATSLIGGLPQTINVGTPAVPGPVVVSNYTQSTTGTLLLQVVSNEGVLPQTQAAAGVYYDTLAATGTASFMAAPTDTIVLNFQGAAPALPGQQFQVVSVPGPLNTALVTSSSATNPTAVTTTGNINPNIIPITSYNDSFNGAFANNNIIVTLFQPFNTFAGQGLTPNQNSVANSLDTIANNLFNPANGFVTANGVILTPFTGVNKDFFDNILEGVSLAGGAGNLGQALDELSPQRFEVLRNVAYDNYAFDIQSLDQEFARERMGVGGVDTTGFVFNNSQLGPELSQVRSRLLAWSPAPEPGLLSDSSQAVLGGVKMADKKDMKEMAPVTPENQFSVFIDGGVDLGDKDGNEDLSHSSYTTGRVRVGADYRVCTDLRVGVLFGYNHTDADLDNEGSKAHVDGYTPGVFLTYADKDGFYANGLFTYTDNEYKTDRDIIIPGVNRTANGSFSGNQFGGDLDGGYDFHRGDWTFGPSAGLTYVNLGMDSFTESGAGAADLGVNSQSSDSLRSRLGGTVSYRTEIGSVVLTPYVSAYWQHEFLDNSTNITSSFVGLPGGTFAVQTTSGDSDNALVGAGLNAELNQTVTLFVDYGAEAGGSSFFGQSATGGVKIGF